MTENCPETSIIEGWHYTKGWHALAISMAVRIGLKLCQQHKQKIIFFVSKVQWNSGVMTWVDWNEWLMSQSSLITPMIVLIAGHLSNSAEMLKFCGKGQILRLGSKFRDWLSPFSGAAVLLVGESIGGQVWSTCVHRGMWETALGSGCGSRKCRRSAAAGMLPSSHRRRAREFPVGCYWLTCVSFVVNGPISAFLQTGLVLRFTFVIQH